MSDIYFVFIDREEPVNYELKAFQEWKKSFTHPSVEGHSEPAPGICHSWMTRSDECICACRAGFNDEQTFFLQRMYSQGRVWPVVCFDINIQIERFCCCVALQTCYVIVHAALDADNNKILILMVIIATIIIIMLITTIIMIIIITMIIQNNDDGRKVLESSLNRGNTIKAINAWTVAAVRYSAGVVIGLLLS